MDVGERAMSLLFVPGGRTRASERQFDGSLIYGRA